jgi:hypothetical protein
MKGGQKKIVAGKAIDQWKEARENTKRKEAKSIKAKKLLSIPGYFLSQELILRLKMCLVGSEPLGLCLP